MPFIVVFSVFKVFCCRQSNQIIIEWRWKIQTISSKPTTLICCIFYVWYDQTIPKMQIHLISLFESNWIIDISNTSTCTTCFSSQLNVVPRRFIIKIKLQSKLRTKYFHLDHMTNFGICNSCFYLMVFVGLFVVKGEGRICVTESRYWTRDD